MSNINKLLQLQSGVARTVSLIGGNTLETSALQLDGSTSGTLTFSASATTTNYSLVWPSAQGASSAFLQNDGSGNLSWAQISSSPAISNTFVAGQSFAANTSYVVRWGMNALSETTNRIYAADYDTSSYDEFWALGIAFSASGATAGQNITVTSFGSYTLGSSDTPFSSANIGDPFWLTSGGAFSAVAPTGTTESDLKVGVIMSTTQVWIDGQMMGIGSVPTGAGPNPLEVTGGGTGLTSLSPYAVICGGTGSNTPMQQVSGLGTSGYVLTSNGVSALPTWQAAASPVVYADSIVNTSGTVTLVNDSASPGNSQYYGTNSGGTLGYYSLPVSGINQLTGDITAGPGTGSQAATLATVNSNTGSFGSSTSIPSFTVNAKGLITAASGNAVVAPAGTLSGSTLNSSVTASSLTSLGTQAQALNMGSNKVTSVATPTVSTDAATKGYVDSAISGLTWQGPAKAYAASNVPLTGASTLTIDGYSVQNGDLVILGNQTTASQNGEYTASGIGSAYLLTANGLPSAAGDAWLILNGTIYADSAFVANAAVPSATFTEFAGPTAYTFNAPLSLSGNTVSISQANTSTNGYLSSSDWSTFNNKQPAGSYITSLTGDVTASGPGAAAASLTATTNSTITTLSSLSLPGSQVTGNISGNAANITATTNSTLTSLPSLTLPTSQLSGTISLTSQVSGILPVANGGTGVATASANTIFAGPTSGSAAAPAFRALGVADMTVSTHTLTESVGATTINWSLGNLFTLTLNANLTVSFSNQLSGQTIVVRLTNTASNYTVAWPTVRWATGTAPTMTGGAVSDVYTFIYDGSNTYGSFVQNMS